MTTGLDAAAEAVPPADFAADFDSLPVIDIAPMLGDDAVAKARVAAELRDACIRIGFFYITGHGVPQALIDEVFAQGPRFFGLPLDEKMKLHVKKSSQLLGYVTLRDENANPAIGQGDLHEAFDFAREDQIVDGIPMQGDVRQTGNHWPEGLPGFREAFTRYSIATRQLADRMFAAFALALGLPENYFATLAANPMSLVRILYYPPQPGPLDERNIGTGSHTDHECFTILAQDDVPALQVKNKRGHWVDAPRIPGAFVVNIGDQMARWTNGLFASTPHRVANLSGRPRYSLPCFVGPNFDAVIQALPSCVGPDNPPKYEPIVAGEYVSSLIYHQFNDNRTLHPSKRREF